MIFSGEATGQADDLIRNSSDKFGRIITGATSNKLDIASHYPFSAERLRLFVSGTRQFQQYSDIPQYNHNKDVHELKPNAGETVVLQTAERPRYVVQYELLSSFAFSINQSLQTGDRVRVGLYDGTDGWFMEHNADHGPKQVDLVSVRDGSEQYREEDKSLAVGTTTFSRYSLQSSWYNVGSQEWKQTSVIDNKQENNLIGEVGLESGRGPKVGNLPLRYEVTAGNSTSNLILNGGSFGSITLGNTNGIVRTKTVPQTINIGSTGSYLPLLAIRVDPDRSIVNTQFIDIEIFEFGGAGDVQLLVQAHDPSKVLDSGDNELGDSDYSTPDEMSSVGSIIEETTNLAKAPDSTGSPTSSTSNPGGYQIGWASRYTAGTGSKQVTSGNTTKRKRSLYGTDTAVIWGKADATGDVTFEYTTEQDW